MSGKMPAMAWACGTIAALALGGCAVQPASAPATASVDADAAIEQFVALANEARDDGGCAGGLVWREDLAAVAQAHSEDMARHGYFSHVSPNGRTPMRRVQEAHVPAMAVAENIAQGHPTGAAVLRGWLESPGHRRNLLNCDYTHHGVGLARGHWTHVLVRLMPGAR